MSSTNNYSQGYSKATTATHTSRTVHSDAGFLLPHLRPTDKILDVGCGPGTISVGLATYVPDGSVLGIDISEDVLVQANELALSKLNVSFQECDIRAGLPFTDNTFDVVFSSQLFPHLTTEQMKLKALSEMRRVLKQGGVLATRDAAELHFYPRSHFLDRYWTGNMARALGGPLPGGDMPGLYRKVGFEPASITVDAGTTVYADQKARRWFADQSKGRLAKGDPYRESWTKVGITEKGISEAREALAKWAEDDDAWYVALQTEIVARKD